MTSLAYFGHGVEPFAVEGVRFEWDEKADSEYASLSWSLPDWSTSITVPIDHAAAVQLMDLVGGRKTLRGAAVCACHQLPFPDAQDYRRRTKHRRRRARR